MIRRSRSLLRGRLQRVAPGRSCFRTRGFRTIALIALLGTAVIIVVFTALVTAYPLPNANTRLNYLLSDPSSLIWRHAYVLWPDHPRWGTVEDLPALRVAEWPGSFPVPELRAPTPEDSLAPPAFLMLHVFSMINTTRRHRRELIRAHHPGLSVPLAYRHLVDFRFVLGRPELEDMTREQKRAFAIEMGAMKKEQEQYRDLILLEGLRHGENMNDGKTLAWVRWVGRQGGREAQWVIKCDDDTLPLLPNLLDYLLELDPAKPTYIGTALGHAAGYAYYFEGMIYGFNWGVVKAIDSADLDESTLYRHFAEDAYTGLLMYNLPSKPGLTLDQADEMRRTDPSDGHPVVPPSPDPRTGLVRVDWGNLAGDFEQWWIADAGTAIAWHNLKSEEAWLAARDRVVKRFGAMGKEYMWTPPMAFRKYADSRLIVQRRSVRHGTAP